MDQQFGNRWNAQKRKCEATLLRPFCFEVLAGDYDFGGLSFSFGLSCFGRSC